MKHRGRQTADSPQKGAIAHQEGDVGKQTLPSGRFHISENSKWGQREKGVKGENGGTGTLYTTHNG